jgi:pimeloyl-ACP methyl ester carboxylesterase
LLDPGLTIVAVGEESFFGPLLPIFVEGYHAKGMAHLKGARIPDAGHYLLADNPKAIADLIEKYTAGSRDLAGRGLYDN